jgi:hypothetical protein
MLADRAGDLLSRTAINRQTEGSKMRPWQGLAIALALAATPPAARADDVPAPLAASNMAIIGHSDLNGVGKGGEGLALKSYADGRRVLFLAHESAPMCFSVIDVTRPEAPQVLVQLPVEASYVRCNSLSLAGDVLVVARQTDKVGQPYGGVTAYDVKDPAKPAVLSHLDLTGTHSRGTHYLNFADERYAYLSTGARDFRPNNPLDDQFLMIVDFVDPRHPKEVGRWWLPGTRRGDRAPAPPRVQPFDAGYRLHTAVVPPERPDRIYTGWIDGGMIVLDVSNKAHLRLVSRISWQSLGDGFMHTVVPLLDRGIALATQEATHEKCADWPKRIWIVDIAKEAQPFPRAVLPPPSDQAALCQAGGRFGAHNINLNRVAATERSLRRTVVTAQFDGGIRAYSIADPDRPVEIGYLIPKPPAANKTGTIQMNDLMVDETGLIYANDRLAGGLYIIRYTGTPPLD